MTGLIEAKDPLWFVSVMYRGCVVGCLVMAFALDGCASLGSAIVGTALLSDW